MRVTWLKHKLLFIVPQVIVYCLCSGYANLCIPAMNCAGKSNATPTRFAENAKWMGRQCRDTSRSAVCLVRVAPKIDEKLPRLYNPYSKFRLK